MATSEGSSSQNRWGSPEASRRKCEEDFSKDEEDLILRMYKLVGERWSLIAGRIPGRSADQIKIYCTCRFSNSRN